MKCLFIAGIGTVHNILGIMRKELLRRLYKKSHAYSNFIIQMT
jgi:hypothetical protein